VPATEAILQPVFLTSSWGDFSTSSFTLIDLIAATTNAFNGALLARRPDHWKHWTVVGILLMAVLGGIGGGVTRDVLLNKIPAALTHPSYLILCTLAAVVALRIDWRAGQYFREGLFQFMTAFSLPWYAVVGTDAALNADLPYLGCILIGVVGPTAGRYFIDVTSGLPPKHFIKGEWFVGTAVLVSVVYIVCYEAGLSIWPASLISFAVGFGFRLLALSKAWEEPEPWMPESIRGEEEARPTLSQRLRGDIDIGVDKP